MDEMRLSIIRKQKGPENAKDFKKYAELEVLDSKNLTKNVMSILRPETFEKLLDRKELLNLFI